MFDTTLRYLNLIVLPHPVSIIHVTIIGPREAPPLSSPVTNYVIQSFDVPPSEADPEFQIHGRKGDHGLYSNDDDFPMHVYLMESDQPSYTNRYQLYITKSNLAIRAG